MNNYLLDRVSQPSIAKTILCTDAAAANIIAFNKQVSACVVGADSILSDGSIVNKTGTFGISLACQSANIPLYVLSDTFKIRPNEPPPTEWESGPASDLVENGSPLSILYDIDASLL
jgi:translation initiation factor 2B subunit (eIF-2B alpha/beta/delta family)